MACQEQAVAGPRSRTCRWGCTHRRRAKKRSAMVPSSRRGKNLKCDATRRSWTAWKEPHPRPQRVKHSIQGGDRSQWQLGRYRLGHWPVLFLFFLKKKKKTAQCTVRPKWGAEFRTAQCERSRPRSLVLRRYLLAREAGGPKAPRPGRVERWSPWVRLDATGKASQKESPKTISERK